MAIDGICLENKPRYILHCITILPSYKKNTQLPKTIFEFLVYESEKNVQNLLSI